MTMDAAEITQRFKGTLAEVLGIRFVEATPERLVAELTYRPDLTTVGGSLHGGTLMAFADTVGAAATVLNLPPGASTTTLESKTNFFAAGRAGIVRAEEAGALRGDRRHPYTRGALCAKVHRYLDYTRAPDRLLHPQRRVGAKGEGRFARISWDEALDEIAARWQAIIRRHGPQAIWPYYGTGAMGMLQGLAGAGRRLWNVLGTSQHVMTICTIAGAYGTGYTLGDNRVGMDPETLGASKLILLWGTNTLTTNHHLWKYIEAARRNGARLVAIDPIRTRTAAAADEHLAIHPGTDAALALGLLHVVVTLGQEDRAFIDAHTSGWEAFRRRILEFPPERVSGITRLPRERIVRLGERLATTRPTGIRLTMGLQRHAGGGMAVRAITCIPGVTGDWQYPGGGAVYDVRGFVRANWPALWRDDLRPAGTRRLSMTRLGEGLLEVKDPPVESLLIYAS